MRHLTRPRGMTLIEIMVALCIAAILAVAAAPHMGDYIVNSRLRETGNALMAQALYAQSEALKRNGQVRLSVLGTSAQVLDVSTGVPVLLRTHPFTDGHSAAATTIDFGSDGMTRPVGTDQSVDIAASGVTCSSDLRCPRLRVEAGGTIRLCGNKLSCT
jgi:type IV fimbrial biogenesis protein FimT